MIKFIGCFVLFFMCVVLPLNAQAAQESVAPPPDSVKVYSETSVNSDVAANLIAGNTVQVMEEVGDDQGENWYKIRTDFGAEGYVRADELERLNRKNRISYQTSNPSSSEENDLERETVEGVSDEADSKEDHAKETTFEEDVSYSQKSEDTNQEVIALAKLNLRKMPSARSEIISKLKQGTSLKYLQKLVNDDGESWYKVEYDEMEGYVIAKAVRLVEVQHADEEKTDSETEHAADYEGSEESPRTEVLSKEIIQTETLVQEERSQHQTENSVQFAFEVDEEPDIQKEHHSRNIDWMLVLLITGELLCVTVIIIFLIKIRKLHRK